VQCLVDNNDAAINCRFVAASGMWLMDHCHFRGSVAFSQFGTLYPRYTLTMPLPILPPKGYPIAPQSLGEHLRKKTARFGLILISGSRDLGAFFEAENEALIIRPRPDITSSSAW